MIVSGRRLAGAAVHALVLAGCADATPPEAAVTAAREAFVEDDGPLGLGEVGIESLRIIDTAELDLAQGYPETWCVLIDAELTDREHPAHGESVWLASLDPDDGRWSGRSTFLNATHLSWHHQCGFEEPAR